MEGMTGKELTRRRYERVQSAEYICDMYGSEQTASRASWIKEIIVMHEIPPVHFALICESIRRLEPTMSPPNASNSY